MNIKWIGLLSIVASIAGYGCSSNPAQTDFGLPSDDAGAGTSSGSSGDDSGGASSSGGTSSSNGGSSNGGGSNGASSGSNGGSSSGTASGSSGGSSTGSSGGSGGSSSGSNCTSDAGSDPDTDYCTKPVTLTMSPFSVSAGGEVYYEQTFANPWGKQVDIKTYDLNMSPGSHHIFAFYVTNATNSGTAVNVPNGGITFGPYTFTAQSPKVTSTYPQSVGAAIPATTGFKLSVHYLNTGSTTLNASVALTMSIAKTGVVTNHAGAIFLNQVQMSVPAYGCTTAPGCASTSTYTLPQDVNIMWAGSHMHKFATGFTATTNTGVTIFSTTEWAEPPAKVYSPPLHLAAGTVITWSCTDVNTTGATLTFGEHATTNVMCIASDGFYPVSDINNPVIGSQF